MFDLSVEENVFTKILKRKLKQKQKQSMEITAPILESRINSGKDCLPFPECGVDFSELESILDN